ncbi:MAG TPA: carbohydrate kinase, partial [Leucothrix sp.]|nr:carbohydrate kinase [Leucothrix sp.]
MTKFYAGIDLGTSGCRLMVIDADKRVHSSAVVAYDDPDKQTPELWWDSVAQLLGDLPRTIKKNLQSIAVDGTSGTILIVDDNGEPLTQVLMYNDLRATDEAEIIKQVLPKENGGQGASGSLARLMWLLKNDHVKVGGCATEPKHTPPLLHDDLNIPIHAVHQADYILGKLANNYTFSDENNCLKLGYDVVNQCWQTDELQKLGIDKSLLPNVFPAGTVVAQIDSKQAESLSLSKSLQLVAGTTDSIAAFIATGADKVGEAVTSLGSTLVLKLISDQPIFSPEHGIYSHRLNNQWLVGGASNSGAKVLQHYFSQTQIDEMTTQLSPDNPTNLDYYPLIKAGERFPVADATKQPKLLPRPESDIEFFQGILEGIATIESQGYGKLVELGAPAVTSVRSVGGGSKNKAWTRLRENRLKVDMLSDKRKPEYTEAAYGSALLALKGL